MTSSRVLCSVFSTLLLLSGCAERDPLAQVRTLQDQGKYEESIAPLRELLTARPDLSEASRRLGEALLRTGHASEAVWPLHRAAASETQATDAGLLLAQAFLATRNFDEALRATDAVLAAEPGHTEAQRLRGTAALGAGQPNEALTVADHLLAVAADDRAALELKAAALVALESLDDAEATYRRLADVTADDEDHALAGRACLALAAFYAEQRKDAERAAAHAADCRDRHPNDQAVLQLASRLADRADRSDDATGWWRQAVAERPDELALRAMLAQRLERSGATDEAQAVLEEGTLRDDSGAAWQVLADFHRRRGNSAAAEAALREVAARGEASTALLRFTRADLLIEMGDVAKAEALAAEIDDPGLQQLMRARILAAQGSYRDALAAFDEAIPAWPNNPGARFLAGLTAERVGDFDRAIGEYRAAVRAGRRDTDAALAAARLYLALRQPSYAAEFARIHLGTGRPTVPDGMVVLARALTALKSYDAARAVIDRLAAVPGWRVTAVVERATLARTATDARQAAAEIVTSGLDLTAAENEAALRALVENLLDTGAVDEALTYTDAALSADPSAAALHDIHARALARAGRADEARRAFERARSIDPAYAPAVAGLATLAATSGDTAGAVRLYDEASAIDPADVDSRYRAAQLVLAAQETADARVRLEEVLALAPTHASAANDLAWLLADSGEELGRAQALAERAVALDANVDTLDTLGWVQLKRGQMPQAVSTFERALTDDPDAALVRTHLAEARARQ